MPELPEVETVRRGLTPVMVGANVTQIEKRRVDLRFPFGRNFKQRIEGARVETLGRRAKYLLAELSTGDCLVMHLGMSGRFLIQERHKTASSDTLGDYVYATGANAKHDHVIFQLSNGYRVTYNDPRRFGFMLLIQKSELERHKFFRDLGVEPLSNQLSAQYLALRAMGRRTHLKSFLMDQRIVAGLGNIYACEALHHARVSPNRAAASLVNRHKKPTERAERLVVAIRDVLQKAIQVGGSTLRDYRGPSGESGRFQENFAVYDRECMPCRRTWCNGVVKRSVHQGRSTFHCGSCQR